MMDLIEIQKILYDRLSECSYSVVDDYILYSEIEPPFIQLSSLYIDTDDTKVENGLEVECYINVYSTYQGKKEILEIIQEVNNKLSDYETTYSTTIINRENNLKNVTYNIYIVRDRATVMLDVDKHGNKFYKGVLLFVVHIN